MKKNNKTIALTIFTLSIILGALCGGSLKADAIEGTTTTSTYSEDNSSPKCPCPRGGRVLKESISQLKESGVLTEDDVKRIDSYMIKDREAKKDEIKEQIYNAECEKIDKMVNEKVITKEKGEKLKASVKENIQDMKRNMKKVNNK